MNVVKINLDAAGATNTMEYVNTEVQQNPADKRQIMTSSGPQSQIQAMLGGITVSRVAGPLVGGVNRGARFIEVGFAQVATLTLTHADFNDSNPKVRRVSNLEGKSFIDSAPLSQPWYLKDYFPIAVAKVPGYRSYFGFGDDQVRTKVYFEMSDSPRINATDSLAIGGDNVDFYTALVTFKPYFVVHTKDEANDADLSYTIRAKGNWTFDGSGNVSNDANHTWAGTAAKGEYVKGDTAFTEQTAGDIIPLTLTQGSTANNAVNQATWSTVNQ